MLGVLGALSVNCPSNRETEASSVGLACLATSGPCWLSVLASQGGAILGTAKGPVSVLVYDLLVGRRC